MQLHHAGILRSPKRVRVNQFGLTSPGFPIVAGTHQDQVAIWIGVSDPALAERTPVRRSTKRDEQLAVGPADHRWKRTVKTCILVDDQVFDLAQRLRGRRSALAI